MTSRPRLALSLAAVSLMAATAFPALAQQPSKAGHYEQGVFVPEGNTLAEVLEQKAANQAQADAAAKQTAADKARLDAYAQAQAAYRAQLAQIDEQKKAAEAEAARIAADHEAAMAKWRADVAACQSGDKSRCAKPAGD